MEDFKKVVGNNIKKYRKMLNFTQEDLAFNMNIRPQTISGIENGHSYPSSTMIVKIAENLKVPVASLFVVDSDFQNLDDSDTALMIHDALAKLDNKKRQIALKAIEFIAQTDI